MRGLMRQTLGKAQSSEEVSGTPTLRCEHYIIDRAEGREQVEARFPGFRRDAVGRSHVCRVGIAHADFAGSGEAHSDAQFAANPLHVDGTELSRSNPGRQLRCSRVSAISVASPAVHTGGGKPRFST
jgi:hypothetical protein